MSLSNEAPTNTSFSWSALFKLLKEYYIDSEDRSRAWAYLLGILICTIISSLLIVAISWCSAAFITALTAKMLVPFLYSLLNFAVVKSGIIAFSSLKDYLSTKLSVLWRNWLTKKTLKQYLEGENNFVDLKYFSEEIDNVPQRIQEDIKRLLILLFF